MFETITSSSILTQATSFAGSFEAAVTVAIGLGVAVTVAYAIKNMF